MKRQENDKTVKNTQKYIGDIIPYALILKNLLGYATEAKNELENWKSENSVNAVNKGSVKKYILEKLHHFIEKNEKKESTADYKLAILSYQKCVNKCIRDVKRWLTGDDKKQLLNIIARLVGINPDDIAEPNKSLPEQISLLEKEIEVRLSYLPGLTYELPPEKHFANELKKYKPRSVHVNREISESKKHLIDLFEKQATIPEHGDIFLRGKMEFLLVIRKCNAILEYLKNKKCNYRTDFIENLNNESRVSEIKTLIDDLEKQHLNKEAAYKTHIAGLHSGSDSFGNFGKILNEIIVNLCQQEAKIAFFALPQEIQKIIITAHSYVPGRGGIVDKTYLIHLIQMLPLSLLNTLPRGEASSIESSQSSGEGSSSGTSLEEINNVSEIKDTSYQTCYGKLAEFFAVINLVNQASEMERFGSMTTTPDSLKFREAVQQYADQFNKLTYISPVNIREYVKGLKVEAFKYISKIVDFRSSPIALEVVASLHKLNNKNYKNFGEMLDRVTAQIPENYYAAACDVLRDEIKQYYEKEMKREWPQIASAEVFTEEPESPITTAKEKEKGKDSIENTEKKQESPSKKQMSQSQGPNLWKSITKLPSSLKASLQSSVGTVSKSSRIANLPDEVEVKGEFTAHRL